MGYGYEMYTSAGLKADSERRLNTLWTALSAHVPALADHANLVKQNAKYVVMFIMYMFLASPCLVLCGHFAIMQILAWGLYVALFANPYVVYTNAEDKAIDAVTTAYALKHLSVLG